MDRFERFRIGAWTVVSGENRLVGPHGRSCHLSPKAMDVLVCLARKPGQVLSRGDLMDSVWDTRFVTEGVLANAVRELRSVFGDDARNPTYIETIPKRGYRLVASVSLVDEPSPGGARAGIRPAWLGGAVILAAVSALALWSGVLRAPEPARLAVLAFDDLSPTPADPAFAHGITDLVLTELAGLNGLHVISGAGLGRLPEPDLSKQPAEIARQLNAELLLRGSILYSDDRVRINTRLVDGPSGMHLWAGTYESDLGNVLDLQRKVARAVAQEIRVRIRPAEDSRLSRRHDVDPDAFLEYTRGVHLFDQWENQSLSRSVSYFEGAIEKDPEFAPARARLARSLVALAMVEAITPADAHGRALRNAQTALRLDENLAEGHAALALVRLLLEWDLAGAEAAIGQALALNRGAMVAHETESLVHMAAGRHDENIAAMRRAHDLAPLSYYTNLRLAWSYYMAGRHLEAIPVLEKTSELYPEKKVVHVFLARNHAMLGQADRATDACERAQHACVWVRAQLGMLDDPDRWREALRAGNFVGSRELADRVTLAGALAALGSADEAFRHLARAVDEGSPDAVFFASYPELRPLRVDQRWDALSERVSRGSPLQLAVQDSEDITQAAAPDPR